MKRLIIKILYYDLSPFKWGRKYIGGNWFRMRTALPMADVWCQEPFTSCQAKVIETESYNEN